MPQLVKDNQIVENDGWHIADEGQAIDANAAKTFISLEAYLSASPEALPSPIGVHLKSDEDVESIAPHLGDIDKVAFQVDNFMDGRTFSQARILREQLGYQGDIRVVGEFIPDQLFFLKRCGFNEFAFTGNADLDLVKESLNSFSDSYQAACDVSEPLFRRRT